MRAFIALLLVAAATARMAPLLTVDEPITGRYIVKLQDGVDVDSLVSRASIAGGRVSNVYKKVLNGFSLEMTSDVVDLVRQLPGVEYVEEDGIARAMAVGSWGLDRIDQVNLPLDNFYTPTGTGSGYTVYVLDTGIRTSHNDFGTRATGGYEGTYGTSEDGNGHGTHCAGTVGGTTYGVAKGVNLVACKVLGDAGYGSWSTIIAGCEWVADDSRSNKIASMSLGGGYSQSVNDAIEGMVAAGVKTAIAAGNSNADACNYSPASAPSAVTVGSTTSTDGRSYFSNYGTCVDIFAPGSSITSAWYTSNSATNTISGTSMACPHVAGALALYGNNDAALIAAATNNVVSNPGSGSPNKLLYVS